MKSKLIVFVLICIFAMTWSDTTLAQINCTMTLPGAYTGGGQILSVLACPAGDGEPLSNAWLRALTPIPYNATITARIFEGTLPIVPIANFPNEDIWLEFVDLNPPTPNPPYSLCFCMVPMIADAPSDNTGQVTFSGPLNAGGCVQNPRIELYVAGNRYAWVNTTNFEIVSVDVNCDLMVNNIWDTPDLTILRIADLWCGDLNHDTLVKFGGMKDASILSKHLPPSPHPIPPLHTCP